MSRGEYRAAADKMNVCTTIDASSLRMPRIDTLPLSRL